MAAEGRVRTLGARESLLCHEGRRGRLERVVRVPHIAQPHRTTVDQRHGPVAGQRAPHLDAQPGRASRGGGGGGEGGGGGGELATRRV